MDIKTVGTAGIAGLLCMVTSSAAAAVHYDVNAPSFIVFVGIILPPVVVSITTWEKAEARLIAGLALMGVSLFSAFWTAISVFHDGL